MLWRTGRSESDHGLANGNDSHRVAARHARGGSRLCRRLDHQQPGDTRHHHRGVAVCDLIAVGPASPRLRRRGSGAKAGREKPPARQPSFARERWAMLGKRGLRQPDLCQADHLTKYSLAQIDWKSWLGKWVARRPKDEPVIDIGYAATGGNSWSELFSPEPAKCPVDSWTGDRKHFCQIAARLNTQQHVASIIDHCAPMLGALRKGVKV